MQRKNKSITLSSTTTSVPIQDIVESSSSPKPREKPQIITATVHRPTFGTSPFAKYWLNVDCCGLFCAGFTYMLHGFGCYAFGWILVPSGWRKVDFDGNVELSAGGIIHRTLFILIALLAVISHFKAMTTDPGAVPPDANPLNDEGEDLEWVVKGEQQHHRNEYQRSHSGHLHATQPQALMPEESVGLLSEEEQCNDENGLEDININDPSNNHSNLHSQQDVLSSTATQALSGVAMAAMAPAAVMGAGMAAMTRIPTNLVTDNEHNDHHNHQTKQHPVRGKRMCRRCKTFKPPRAHHCSICKRCIIKMDHHCPWVNNCVGIGNHKFFLLFIFYTSLSCLYSLGYITSRFINCVGSHSTMSRCVDHASDLLPLIGLTVEALLFGLFTICMMVDQWDVVVTNLTHIDRLKGEYHNGYYNPNNQHTQNLKSNTGVHEVFGARAESQSSSGSRPRFHYTWMSPFHKVCFPEPLRDDIFGYCRPCGGFNAANFFKGSNPKGQNSIKTMGRGTIQPADIV